MFSDLLYKMREVKHLGFDSVSSELISFVDNAPDFLDILTQIGTIPEFIEHDSTKEKLFSKISDAVLARAFREIGLSAIVLKARSNSADVLAKSTFYNYTLVADAKAFRLSRTAKNQKDFKVESLSDWRKDNDYAVLCSPYFQYPSKKSQIYAQALNKNVCLLSWEHLIFLIENHIQESEQLSLAPLWNASTLFAKHTLVSENEKCFMPDLNQLVFCLTHLSEESFSNMLADQVQRLKSRADIEQQYWQSEKERILAYSHEQAIQELIKARKIDEKLRQINAYIEALTTNG